MVTVEKVNFDYTIRGGDEHIRPVACVRRWRKDLHSDACRDSAPGSAGVARSRAKTARAK